MLVETHGGGRLWSHFLEGSVGGILERELSPSFATFQVISYTRINNFPAVRVLKV